MLCNYIPNPINHSFTKPCSNQSGHSGHNTCLFKMKLAWNHQLFLITLSLRGFALLTSTQPNKNPRTCIQLYNQTTICPPETDPTSPEGEFAMCASAFGLIPKVIPTLLNKTIWPQAQEVTPLVDLKGLVTREDPCEGEIQPMEERTSHLVASIAQTAISISIGIERNGTKGRSINVNTTTTVAVNQKISVTNHAWTLYQILFNKNLAVSDIMVHHWSKNISLRPCDT